MARHTTVWLRCLGITIWTAASLPLAMAYDPLTLTAEAEPPRRLAVEDPARDREIPLLVSLPQGDGPAAVVLFSHGLGGSRDGCRYLREHWSGRGYAAVFLQHPGSDALVWQGVPVGERRAAMQEAASAANMRHRIADVGCVLDTLGRWNTEPAHPLCGRLDLEQVGMSGHSFGAQTTQAVSGMSGRPARLGPDPRINAAVIFSPGRPVGLRTAEAAFGEVRIPWLLMTGTKDVSPIGNQTVESRLEVFPALPPGDKYELVFEGGTHAAFTDGRGLPSERNPNHHRAILAITTAFWDAYLRQNAAAEAWLTGDGPRSVLAEQDRWQTK